MICKLCGKYYLDEDSILTIFSFSEICEGCKRQFHPKLSYEVFPLDGGLVRYYYLYEDISFNNRQSIYLSKHLLEIYKIIIEEKNTYDLFIYLDDVIYHNTKELLLILSGFKHVFMFSLFRRDLMYKINI